MTYTINKFFKVLVISVDIFHSNIIDEKHFSKLDEAESFISNLKNTTYIGVLVEL